MATVLITGASTGLGRATAVTLARGGHDVYATMRNPERSPELQTIARKESLPISILRLDVDRDDSVVQAVRQVLAERGHVDVLVNNAGILAFGAVEDLPLELMRTFYEKYFDARSNLKYENERKRFTSYFLTFPGGGRLELMHTDRTSRGFQIRRARASSLGTH